MAGKDPKGFYKALNVDPAASQMEIRLAYKFLKRAFQDGKKFTNIGLIQSAYQTLSTPELRAQYDGHAVGSQADEGPPQSRSKLHSIPLLVASGALCIALFALAFGPGVMARWTTFDVGDDLVWKKTSKRLGQVLDYEEAHDFPELATQSAYKVRMSSGVAQWFPAADLHRGAEPVE